MPAAPTAPRLVPAPRSVEVREGAPFVVSASTTVTVGVSPAEVSLGVLAAEGLSRVSGSTVEVRYRDVAEPTQAGDVALRLDESLAGERYRLDVATDRVEVAAGTPEGLVRMQQQHWDPILAWARDSLGARFTLGEGVTFVAQPEDAIAAARAAIPSEPWRLGALNVITTLTGSALIALAVGAGRLDVGAAWNAANVDEDWNMNFWGRDELALQRRETRFADMQSAAKVLAMVA